MTRIIKWTNFVGNMMYFGVKFLPHIYFLNYMKCWIMNVSRNFWWVQHVSTHSSQFTWVIVLAHGPLVFVLGFIMMTPQLFINYKLKSVAHLPWRMLTYKALNTFIDDIFAFVIKMPTLYRIGCFRDGKEMLSQNLILIMRSRCLHD